MKKPIKRICTAPTGAVRFTMNLPIRTHARLMKRAAKLNMTATEIIIAALIAYGVK